MLARSRALILYISILIFDFGPEKLPGLSRNGPQASFFSGRALVWPGYIGERVLGLFGLHPFSSSKSVGFVSLCGKASLVSISAGILFLRSWHVYFPLEFEFRGKSCVEREHGGEDGILCLLPCILLLHVE